VFGSVVTVAFQIAFRAEIHVNDVFSFFKNYFWHQHIKTIQKVQTALNFNKKKNFNLMKHSYKYNIKRSLNRPDRPTPTQPVHYLPSFQAARHPNCIEGLNNRFSVLSVGNSSFQPPDAAKIKLEMRHRLVVFFFFKEKKLENLGHVHRTVLCLG
jgi:hypothetical protein